MDDRTKGRLEKLAAFIEATEHNYPLSQLCPLHSRIQPGWGFSVLGLVCLAHQNLTGNGYWKMPNGAIGLPKYLVAGEKDDTYLPRPVVEYFGFRNNVGSFSVADLPQDVKRLMHQTAKTGRFSLYRVGMAYRKRGREIAVKVIRAMPPSLLKPDEMSSNNRYYVIDHSTARPRRIEPRRRTDFPEERNNA